MRYHINDRVRAVLPIVPDPKKNQVPVVHTHDEGTVVGFDAVNDCYYVQFDRLTNHRTYVQVQFDQIEKVP